jgi:hypothetical protein
MDERPEHEEDEHEEESEEEHEEESHEEHREWSEEECGEQSLLLTVPPHTLAKGRRPSVSIDPERDMMVTVYDDGFGGLYCQVGNVNKRSNTVKWSDPVRYGTGKQPSIALVRLDDHLYVIEVHRAFVFKQCFVKVGAVETGDVKRIAWRAEYPQEVLRCSVVKPKICATSDGYYVIVHEEAYTTKGIRYHYGRFERHVEGDQERLFLSELLRCRPFDGVYGVEPDIAISGNTVAVIFRSGFRDLAYFMGNIHDLRNPIQWLQIQYPVGVVNPSTGVNPSISINHRGYVVVAYQTKIGRQIHYVHGCVKNNSIVWQQDVSRRSSSRGEYPTITLANDGYVVAMCKSWLGHNLFYSVGKLESS